MRIIEIKVNNAGISVSDDEEYNMPVSELVKCIPKRNKQTFSWEKTDLK